MHTVNYRDFFNYFTDSDTNHLTQSCSFPRRQTTGSVGFDLYLPEGIIVDCLNSKPIVVPMGISVNIPSGCYCEIHIRSSIAMTYNICLANSVGIIDSDYKGQIKLLLNNFGNNDVELTRGERIAQLIPINFLIDDSHVDKNVRLGGFGSTNNFN